MTTQLVDPDASVNDYAGFCLRFTQSVYGAPARYASAKEAWDATSYKHGTEESIPYVSVPVWFDHYGTYGNPPTYANWGHVVTYFPGRGYLSSPLGKLGTYGQSWFDSIDQVERAFDAKYVGWSEDINGLRVSEVTNSPVNSKGVAGMATVYYTTENNVTTYALAGDGQGKAAWLETQDVNLATQLVAAHHISQTAVYLTPDSYRSWKANYLNA